jgi:hypothetical protein
MASLYWLFNRQRDHTAPTKKITGATPAGSPPGGGGTPPQAPVGGFITKESLVSFPGATLVISLIWGFINHFVSTTGTTRDVIGAVICFAVGMFMYWINITDPAAPATPREKKIGFVVALLNTIVLFMASFGAQVAIGTHPPG